MWSPRARFLVPCRVTLCLHRRSRSGVGDIPIPERDDKLGQSPYTNRVTVASGESKVRYFNLTTIVHQKVGRLEISVQDPVFVTMGNCGEQLMQESFDLRLQEGVRHDG